MNAAIDASPLVDCPPLENAVIHFIRHFGEEHLTAHLRGMVSRVMRDQFSSQIGNSRLPWSKQVRALAERRHVPGRSRIISSERTMSAMDAAFVNATYAHGFEYDEGHRSSNSHPGSCAVATAVAVGEETGATLGEAVSAILMGYEVYARIGVLAAPDLIQRGFHPASVLASFGAAAVCAKLRQFDDETTLHAMAIALSHASGASECTSTGGSVKRVHPGIGVRGGMMAADLAQAGITGPRAFLSGVKGFYRAFLQRPVASDAAERFGFGQSFEILRGGFKRYCCCGANHAAIDILSAYAGRLDEIAAVTLRIPKLSNTMVGTVNANAYAPANIEHVQFSLPAQAAFALLGYGNGYGAHLSYLEGRLDMDLVMRTARKVTLIESPELDQQYPRKFVTEATVRLAGGRTETHFVENSLGTPDNPMTEEAHDAKFMELTTAALGKARARELLVALHELPDDMRLEDLTAMCVAR
ncbi:MmgE/PrpD family protein [Bordetella tumbae]|uniref:MmgE/PrpD family protein n=1 Tax=Bordetella tumbae TaxID=1649139 RepID=UPI0039EEDF48